MGASERSGAQLGVADEPKSIIFGLHSCGGATNLFQDALSSVLAFLLQIAGKSLEYHDKLVFCDPTNN
jgi:hypothetical protein